MEVKYKSVRASEFQEESQLDRVEKKMDRILELLEGQELSTSIVMDGKEVANAIYPSLTDR